MSALQRATGTGSTWLTVCTRTDPELACRQKMDEVKRLREGKRAGASSSAAAALPEAVAARKALLAQRRAQLAGGGADDSSSGEGGDDDGGDLLDVDWRAKK